MHVAGDQWSRSSAPTNPVCTPSSVPSQSDTDTHCDSRVESALLTVLQLRLRPPLLGLVPTQIIYGGFSHRLPC